MGFFNPDLLVSIEDLKKSRFLLEDEIGGIVTSEEESERMYGYSDQLIRLFRFFRRGDRQRAVLLFDELLGTNLVNDIGRDWNYLVFVDIFSQIALYMNNRGMISQSQYDVYNSILNGFRERSAEYVLNAAMIEGFSFEDGQVQNMQQLRESVNYLMSVLSRLIYALPSEDTHVSSIYEALRQLIPTLENPTEQNVRNLLTLLSLTDRSGSMVSGESTLIQIFIGTAQVIVRMISSYIISNYSDLGNLETVNQRSAGSIMSSLRSAIINFSSNQTSLEQFYTSDSIQQQGASESDEALDSSTGFSSGSGDASDDAEDPNSECDDC